MFSFHVPCVPKGRVHGCVALLLLPLLLLLQHATDFYPIIFYPLPPTLFFHPSKILCLSPTSHISTSCFRAPLVPLSQSFCSAPGPGPTLLSFFSVLHADLIAAILFQWPQLSSYSFSDSHGKTCWLSQSCTLTMTPDPLSGQQWTQPHQFQLVKSRDWRRPNRMTFFLIWGDLHQIQRYALRKGADGQDNGESTALRAINVNSFWVKWPPVSSADRDLDLNLCYMEIFVDSPFF